MSSKSWYLIFSKARQEAVAQRNLERQGYQVFLPLVSQKSCESRVRKTITAPLFPRYLFVELDQFTDNWSPIRSTRGVQALVRFGEDAARVPQDLVQSLQSHAEDLSKCLLQKDRFDVGEKVALIDGPFSGYEGIIHAQQGQDRAIVLLNIVSHYTQVTVGCNTITKL